jgi:hypothetical protein
MYIAVVYCTGTLNGTCHMSLDKNLHKVDSSLIMHHSGQGCKKLQRSAAVINNNYWYIKNLNEQWHSWQNDK